MPENNNLLVIVAIVAVCVALINLSITVNKIGDVKEFTGYATDTGAANLTIVTAASVEFITDSIDWGSGQVNATEQNTYMDSEGNVNYGNWTIVDQGLTLENKGNCNVTFTLTTSNIASSFIEASGAKYDLKVTDNETGTCATGWNSLSTYTNATSVAQDACLNMSWEGEDTVDIDINLTVPQEATAGAKGSIITATANCV